MSDGIDMRPHVMALVYVTDVVVTCVFIYLVTDVVVTFDVNFVSFKPPDEQEKLDDIKFIPSAPTVSQGSYFCGYITTASNLTQVKQAYTRLYPTNPKSDPCDDCL